MQGKVSPIFKLFQSQFEEARNAFLELSRRYRGKKAIELEQKLIFLEIYIDLLAHIHFEDDKLKFKLFSPFQKIFKGLKKTKHLKMVIQEVEVVNLKENIAFNSYSKSLLQEKNKLYAEVFDLIIATPLQIWEDLYQHAFKLSIGLKPLMINTATNQIINEELEYFNLDHKHKFDSKSLKDIYEGVRIITALENLRIESGFNPVFIQEIHDRMRELQQVMMLWYQNHLFIQHLSGFLADKENIHKKYFDLLSELKSKNKINKVQAQKHCRELLNRIMN